MAKRISRKSFRPHCTIRWPADEVMNYLGALVAGERLALTADDRLVLTSGGSAERGLLVPSAVLEEMERRGWVELPEGAAEALVTQRGRAQLRIWYAQKYPGTEFVTARVVGDAHLKGVA